MKKQIITTLLLVGAMLAIIACSKKSSSSSSGSSLNSTETQLVGTWYLQKFVSDTTTITGFSKAFYTIFKSDQYASAGTPGVGSNYKQAISSCIVAVAPPNMTPTVDFNMYWYYDNNVNLLQIVGKQYTIVSLTTSQLVIKIQNAVVLTAFDYYYFSK